MRRWQDGKLREFIVLVDGSEVQGGNTRCRWAKHRVLVFASALRGTLGLRGVPGRDVLQDFAVSCPHLRAAQRVWFECAVWRERR